MRLLAAIVGATLFAAPALAQSFDEEDKPRLRPTGIRAIIGVVSPESASSGLVIGGAVDLGTVYRPWLNLSAAVTRWSADIDRTEFGENAIGDLSDLRIATNVGVTLFRFKADDWGDGGLRAYTNAGIALHFVGADVPSDPSLEDAIEGTNVGAEIGLGLRLREGAFTLSGEARREFVDDVDNWSFVFGIGTEWGTDD